VTYRAILNFAAPHVGDPERREVDAFHARKLGIFGRMLMRDAHTLFELRDRARDVAFVKEDDAHRIVEPHRSGRIGRFVRKG
jgi:hypothetical protein